MTTTPTTPAPPAPSLDDQPASVGMSTAGIENLITAHQAALHQPGVLSVRPGYEVTDGWLTGRKAIVVTVTEKLASPPTGHALPDQIDGIPIDVRQASPLKRLSLTDPEKFAAEHRFAPNHGAPPAFPDEHVFTPADLTRVLTVHPAARLPQKPSLPYTGAVISLTPVTAPMSIQLSASPDNGWPTLKPFLQNTQAALTVGLYDFTSAHILDTVQTALTGKVLQLVLDHPEENPTADQTDETTITDLRNTLGDEFTQAWALTRTDPFADAWIYPYAYHIKVAVHEVPRCSRTTTRIGSNPKGGTRIASEVPQVQS